MTIDEMQKILNTLPIGYYLKRNVSVTLSDTSNSYYNCMTDTITLGYKLICKGLTNVTNDDEEIIRTMLYHEISHVILTPANIFSMYKINTDVINIFEDERIETILHNFYMNVNFKKMLNRICPICTNYTSSIQLFYDIVRHRTGPNQFVKQVNDIIIKYAHINASYDYQSASDVYEYVSDVMALYNNVSEYFKTISTKNKDNETENNKDNETENNKDNEIENNNKDNETENEIKNEETENEIKNEETEDKNETNFNDCITDAINMLDTFSDNHVYSKLHTILNRVNVRNNQQGSSINSYSGKFESRSVIFRQDYKYFSTANKNGNIHNESKIRLNLFIDSSGSFYGNEKATNILLHELQKLEKDLPNFELNLITMSVGEILHSKQRRILHCGGGNTLSNEIFDIYKRVNDDATAINIVLFDGYAFSIGGRKSNISVFNHTNTYVISDIENEEILTKYCKKANVMIVSDYVSSLYTNVYKALERLL